MLQLQMLPDMVLQCIVRKLSTQDHRNLAEAHETFQQLLSEEVFWRSLFLDDDKAFVNDVCHYVLEHSSLVSEVVIDNVSSPESSFISSWTDVLLTAMSNVRKITVLHSTFLTSALFVTSTLLLAELRLHSCPNLSAFTVLQGFLCTRP